MIIHQLLLTFHRRFIPNTKRIYISFYNVTHFALRCSCSIKMENNEIKIDTEPKIVKEGSAEILVPDDGKIFYNPVQEFNRDLSVLALHVLSKEIQANTNGQSPKTFRILEAFAASGLRSIRYGLEISNVKEVIANDYSQKAVENMEKNIKHNKVENIVKASYMDAVTKMFNSIPESERFQAVDLDPYGSPIKFLDSAVQCVSDGGLLMVTCTDMAVLCGNFPETCYTKYGAVSLRASARHEMAIRIVLQSIQSHASRYKRYIVPLLSVSADFYVRVFVKIFTGAGPCKDVTSKLSMVFQCSGCGSTLLQPLGIVTKKKNSKNLCHSLPNAPPVGQKCVHCGGKFHMGGPIWSAPIHNQSFVAAMLTADEVNNLGTSKRIMGMLSVIQEELIDVPLYYITQNLSAVVRSNCISALQIRSAILNAGYRVSFSHAAKNSLKTDAPMAFIWDIFRTWLKSNPIKSEKVLPGSPAEVILNTPVENDIDFTMRIDANPRSREMKLTRYQQNPMPFWGPGSRSSVKNLVENPKKIRNQNKRTLSEKRNSVEENNKRPNLNTTPDG